MNSNPIKDQNSHCAIHDTPFKYSTKVRQFFERTNFFGTKYAAQCESTCKLFNYMYNHTSRHTSTQQLLVTPSAIFSSLIADIQHARETIDMEYYIFSNDRTGRLFAEILRRKARQGVSVRLIIDGYGSMSLGRELCRAMQSDGVDLRSHALMRRSRFHRKIAVIDDHIAHVGGVNIADRYIVGNTLGRWHDVQLRLMGDAVHDIVRLFDYDYMVSEGLKCEVPMLYSHRGLQVVWSECRGGRAISELLEEVVAEARHTLTFTTPYFMPPHSVLELLSSAVSRGVKVRVIVPERCNVWMLDDIIRRRIAQAAAYGIDMRICRGAFLHAKLAIVDGRRVVVGSANLDSRSLYHNREIMVVTEYRAVVASAKLFVEGLMQLSSPPTASDMRSYIPAFVSRCFEGIL